MALYYRLSFLYLLITHYVNFPLLGPIISVIYRVSLVDMNEVYIGGIRGPVISVGGPADDYVNAKDGNNDPTLQVPSAEWRYSDSRTIYKGKYWTYIQQRPNE